MAGLRPVPLLQVSLAHVCYLIGKSGFWGHGFRPVSYLNRRERACGLFSLHDFVPRTRPAGKYFRGKQGWAARPSAQARTTPALQSKSSAGPRKGGGAESAGRKPKYAIPSGSQALSVG